ncbi:hypothetical protein ALC57_09509 [Trachymyrmex cornetzi]|uniref:Uncharacterized protein n=1 Tax=Trachymyrmex cornetzi TaxID=471704 RepID=A0A195DZX5_9HYME|nr:hypothetical protein ALC57_09509 [Trachymyrmex cornetzi]
MGKDSLENLTKQRIDLVMEQLARNRSNQNRTTSGIITGIWLEITRHRTGKWTASCGGDQLVSRTGKLDIKPTESRNGRLTGQPVLKPAHTPKNQPLTITANILLVIEKFGLKGGREKENYRPRGPAQSTLTPLTENSWQTSGRLDETAERHETEGKRKWQSLSEGASTTLRSSKPLARKWYRGRKFVRTCVGNSPLESYQEAIDYEEAETAVGSWRNAREENIKGPKEATFQASRKPDPVNASVFFSFVSIYENTLYGTSCERIGNACRRTTSRSDSFSFGNETGEKYEEKRSSKEKRN